MTCASKGLFINYTMPPPRGLLSCTRNLAIANRLRKCRGRNATSVSFSTSLGLIPYVLPCAILIFTKSSVVAERLRYTCGLKCLIFTHRDIFTDVTVYGSVVIHFLVLLPLLRVVFVERIIVEPLCTKCTSISDKNVFKERVKLSVCPYIHLSHSGILPALNKVDDDDDDDDDDFHTMSFGEKRYRVR